MSESSVFRTTTDSITGMTCITDGDSFTLCGPVPNWIGCIQQGDMNPGRGVASFDLTLQINYDVFKIMKNTSSDKLHIVVIKDEEDSLVSDGVLSYIISSDSRIQNLDILFRNLGFYSVYGTSIDCAVVKNSSMYAYMSFSYKMYPEERNKMIREIYKLPSRATSK